MKRNTDSFNDDRAGLTHRALRRATCSVHGNPPGWRAESGLPDFHELRQEFIPPNPRTARKIAPHAGVVKSVLRLFDELAKCDDNGILKSVRDAAEGKKA